ncbi:pentatricopeptide repeat-containing protein At4g26680, mitochondrial [Euphorbia lathyris]|uniref:pentatricopeptide repeat-containing protein At4g26680, mitochondrial n=1 Tax=Euphorbia lathyris TaxID=212925 RepID=UPI00331342C9
MHENLTLYECLSFQFWMHFHQRTHLSMRSFLFRRFSTGIKTLTSSQPIFGNRNWNPIPIPSRTLSEPKAQDLDFVNVTHSHLIHSDWDKLNSLSAHFTPFRLKHVLLKIQKDHVLSLEFFNFVQSQNPNSLTLETLSIILHILTKNQKFKSADFILRTVIRPGALDLPNKLFDAILYSYRMCHSSPRVFDLLFKTYAHLRKFRNATDTFSQMKDYGFLPTIRSCNAYLSSLIDSNRMDIALAFYKEMRRNRISPNVYTLNMVMSAFCKLGNLEKAVEVLKEMDDMGINPVDSSYNTLISGCCHKGLLNLAVKLKNQMREKGVEANVITFNTLIYGFCKERKLHEASKVFSEMKVLNVAPNNVTYNTLIDGYSRTGNSEMGRRLYEEMSRNGIKADILTYNALILGLCKEGKTKKAAYMMKELEKQNLAPNASTFSALILGQCIRNNPDRGFQLYKYMVRSGCHPNEQTFSILLSTFCKSEDFEGAFSVSMEMFERCMSPSPDVLLEIYRGLRGCRKDHLANKLCSEMQARHIVAEGFDREEVINSRPE